MKQTITRTIIVVSVLVIAFCAGCAPMTEAQREAREYARVEFRDQFRTEREICQMRGGRFIYDGVAELDRDGVPKTRVWFECV